MDSLSLTVNRNSAPNKPKKTKSSLGTRIGFLKPRTIESSDPGAKEVIMRSGNVMKLG